MTSWATSGRPSCSAWSERPSKTAARSLEPVSSIRYHTFCRKNMLTSLFLVVAPFRIVWRFGSRTSRTKRSRLSWPRESRSWSKWMASPSRTWRLRTISCLGKWCSVFVLLVMRLFLCDSLFSYCIWTIICLSFLYVVINSICCFEMQWSILVLFIKNTTIRDMNYSLFSF